MEPLGAIASVIAISQALAAIPKFIDTVRSLADIRNELASLVNELETLRATHEQIRRLIEALSDDIKTGHGSEKYVSDIQKMLLSEAEPLRKASLQLESIMLELEQLRQKCCHGVDKQARPRPRKLKWLWRRSQIEKIYERVRDMRLNLQLALSTISLFTIRSQSTLLFEIRAITHISAKKVDHNFQDIRDRLGTSTTGTELIVREETQSPGRLDATSKSIEEEVAKSFEPACDSSQYPRTADININDYMTIETSLRGICHRACTCQCHIKRIVTNNQWLKPWLGSFFLGFNGIPVFDLMKCDESGCSRQSSALQFSYYFPSWLSSRALSLTWDVGSMTNAGATLHYSFPRILPFDDQVWYLIGRGTPSQYKKFLSSGQTCYPTDIACDGDSLLSYAVVWRNYAMIECLLEIWGSSLGKSLLRQYSRRVTVDARLQLENHPFLEDSEINALKKLLSYADDVGEQTQSAIHVAIAKGGATGVVKAIREEPWAVNSVDHLGRTPLHFAIKMGDIEAVDELICAGANVNLKDAMDRTPLMVTVVEVQASCAKKLINARCDIEARNYYGETAMGFVATDHCIEILELLVVARASVTCSNLSLETPLHNLSKQESTKQIARQMVGILLGARADLEARNYHGQTPLLRAVAENRLGLLQVLVEAGAQLDVISGLQSSVLHFAGWHSGADVLEYLMTLDLKGISVEGKNAAGSTAWEEFVWQTRAPDWQLGSTRRPNGAEIDAFVRLYTKLRNEELETEITAMEEVLGNVAARQWNDALSKMDALVKQEKRRKISTETLRTIRLQIRERMVDAAVEALEENIGILKEKQIQSPWEQRTIWDSESESSEDGLDEIENDSEAADDSENDLDN